jgi:hypothetical protein
MTSPAGTIRDSHCSTSRVGWMVRRPTVLAHRRAPLLGTSILEVPMRIVARLIPDFKTNSHLVAARFG